MLLTIVHNKIISFDYLKDLYANDEDCNEEWQKCTSRIAIKPQIHYGFLFFENRLCSPRGSLREHIIRKLHAGGLRGHIG